MGLESKIANSSQNSSISLTLVPFPSFKSAAKSSIPQKSPNVISAILGNFENLQSMSVDELAEWLDKNGQYDGSPWSKWFDSTYCQRCESVVVTREEYKRVFGCCGFGNTVDCAYCEWEGKCKFFPEMDEAPPNNKEIIKMWLESEVKYGA